MDLQLNKKRILITGAAGTIGSATARCFLEEGCHVILADLASRANSVQITSLSSEFPNRVMFVPLDLTSDFSIHEAVEISIRTFGGIDSVVNNAAVFHFSEVRTWKSSQPLDHHYEVGLKGAMNLLREVWKSSPTSLHGSVVNVSSVAGHVGEPDAFAYTPIKAAQKGLTLSCAMEMASYGGWAVSVSPGHTWSAIHESRAKATEMNRTEYEDSMPNIASTLFGRFLEPTEVARWITLAASPLGKPLSGQDLHVSMGIEAGGFNQQYQTQSEP